MLPNQLRAAFVNIRFFCSRFSVRPSTLLSSYLSLSLLPSSAECCWLDWGVSLWLMWYRHTISLSRVCSVHRRWWSKSNPFWLCHLAKEGIMLLFYLSGLASGTALRKPTWLYIIRKSSAVQNDPDKELTYPPNWPLLSISHNPSTPYQADTHAATEALTCQHNEIRQRSLWRCIVLVHLWHHSHPTRPLHPFQSWATRILLIAHNRGISRRGQWGSKCQSPAPA